MVIPLQRASMFISRLHYHTVCLQDTLAGWAQRKALRADVRRAWSAQLAAIDLTGDLTHFQAEGLQQPWITSSAGCRCKARWYKDNVTYLVGTAVSHYTFGGY